MSKYRNSVTKSSKIPAIKARRRIGPAFNPRPIKVFEIGMEIEIDEGKYSGCRGEIVKKMKHKLHVKFHQHGNKNGLGNDYEGKTICLFPKSMFIIK